MAKKKTPNPIIKQHAEDHIVRFDGHQRVMHVIMILTFVGLALSGLPMKFSTLDISRWWIEFWGGFEMMRTVHHLAAYGMVGLTVYHLLYIGISTWVVGRPFPLRMLPCLKDLKDAGNDIKYFVGANKEGAKYDRFNWKDKFDYWAIFWGMPIMVLSGFALLFPAIITETLSMPSWAVNVAYIAHTDEAILAVCWIFIFHFFFNHMTPGIFPLNKVIFTGVTPKEEYIEEHPIEWERWVKDRVVKDDQPAS